MGIPYIDFSSSARKRDSIGARGVNLYGTSIQGTFGGGVPFASGM